LLADETGEVSREGGTGRKGEEALRGKVAGEKDHRKNVKEATLESILGVCRWKKPRKGRTGSSMKV